ncbi:MAG: sodium:calcium antiporter, partial [Gammaproteobacteria bacterium]
TRGNGAMFVGYYVAYTMYLVFTAQQAPALHSLNVAMLWFVIPLTLVTLSVSVFRELRKPTPNGA